MEQRISKLETGVAVINTKLETLNTRFDSVKGWTERIEETSDKALAKARSVEQKQESSTERILERLDQLHQNQKTQSERRWKLVTIVIGIVATLIAGALGLALGLK